MLRSNLPSAGQARTRTLSKTRQALVASDYFLAGVFFGNSDLNWVSIKPMRTFISVANASNTLTSSQLGHRCVGLRWPEHEKRLLAIAVPLAFLYFSLLARNSMPRATTDGTRTAPPTATVFVALQGLEIEEHVPRRLAVLSSLNDSASSLTTCNLFAYAAYTMVFSLEAFLSILSKFSTYISLNISSLALARHYASLPLARFLSHSKARQPALVTAKRRIAVINNDVAQTTQPPINLIIVCFAIQSGNSDIDHSLLDAGRDAANEMPVAALSATTAALCPLSELVRPAAGSRGETFYVRCLRTNRKNKEPPISRRLSTATALASLGTNQAALSRQSYVKLKTTPLPGARSISLRPLLNSATLQAVSFRLSKPRHASKPATQLRTHR